MSIEPLLAVYIPLECSRIVVKMRVNARRHVLDNHGLVPLPVTDNVIQFQSLELRRRKRSSWSRARP